MPPPIRIAIIGFGKIARDQHLPAIRRSADFEAVLAVDPAGGAAAPLPLFASLDDALASGIAFDAAAICTPPQLRLGLCKSLAATGCALLLEKPPAPSLRQAEAIARLGETERVSVFTAWHSRFAPQMAAARAWARAHTLASGTIEWRENPDKWHPGQDWLWQPGGFGVFDPGINALSILTGLYPEHWAVQAATVRRRPDADTPVAAEFSLSGAGADIHAAFEFHDREDEIWTIRLTASDGDTLELSEGGAAFAENGGPARRAPVAEYDAVYAEFAALVRERRSIVDLAPLRIVEDVLSAAEQKNSHSG
ncbi:MAG: Gfo/Idh/MocA family protein [Hyphomonas sp.]